MATETKTLVCRRCERPPELVKTENAGDVVRCPRCQVSGNHDEVITAAKKYLGRSVSYSAIEGMQRRLQTSASRSKHVTYKPGKLPSLTPPDFIFS